MFFFFFFAGGCFSSLGERKGFCLRMRIERRFNNEHLYHERLRREEKGRDLGALVYAFPQVNWWYSERRISENLNKLIGSIPGKTTWRRCTDMGRIIAGPPMAYASKSQNFTIELLWRVSTKNFSWTHCFPKAWEIPSSWFSPWVYHPSGICNIVIIVSADSIRKVFASLFFKSTLIF